MQGSGRKKEMRVTAAFRLGDKENDDLVSFSSRIVKRVTQVRFFFCFLYFSACPFVTELLST